MKCNSILLLIIISYIQLQAKVLDVGVSYQYPTIAAAANSAIPGDSIICHDDVVNGGMSIIGLQGTISKWIFIVPENNKQVIIRGGSNSIQFSDAAFLHIERFIIEGQTGNGMNIDDNGTYDSPAHHVRIVNCIFRNINATGNNDLLKLSGIDDFYISGCTFLNGSPGGSGIDMVGCHKGIITQNQFSNLGSNSIQAKGGTTDIEISINHFNNGGARALNLGGSTGLAFFRPQNATAEAERISVLSNVIRGSEAAVAYVGCRDVVVTNNTILFPDKWVIRILQETVDIQRFLPCGNNSFNNNIIVINQKVSTICNIGPDTAPQTFSFANNLWFNTSNPNWQGTNLPGMVENQYFQDPEIITGSIYKILPSSPAVSKGLPYPALTLDIEGNYFNNLPSVGAFEARPLTTFISEKNEEWDIYPNPATSVLNIRFENNQEKEITLFSMSGESMLQLASNSNMIQLNIDKLIPGTYLLFVKEGTKSVQKTIIKL